MFGHAGVGGNEGRGEKRFLAHKKGERSCVCVCLTMRMRQGRGLSSAAISADISSPRHLPGKHKKERKHGLENEIGCLC